MKYDELISALQYCADPDAPCPKCIWREAHCDVTLCDAELKLKAADVIEELMKPKIDEKTALAMMAGSHAIREHAKRYEGSTYMWDVFGERGGPKEICYLEAAKHLMSIAGSILDPKPPKEEAK